jgi:hypothetical protein
MRNNLQVRVVKRPTKNGQAFVPQYKFANLWWVYYRDQHNQIIKFDEYEEAMDYLTIEAHKDIVWSGWLKDLVSDGK